MDNQQSDVTTGKTAPAGEQHPPRPASTRWLVWALVGITAGIFIWVNRPAPPAAFTWERDFETGLARAKTEGRPVLLEFQTAGCPACAYMDREVFSRPEVAKALEGWVPIRIDGNAEPALSRRYRIEAFPTLFALSPDGRVLGAQQGSMSPNEFSAFLASARNKPPTTSPARPMQ